MGVGKMYYHYNRGIMSMYAMSEAHPGLQLHKPGCHWPCHKCCSHSYTANAAAVLPFFAYQWRRQKETKHQTFPGLCSSTGRAGGKPHPPQVRVEEVVMQCCAPWGRKTPAGRSRDSREIWLPESLSLCLDRAGGDNWSSYTNERLLPYPTFF